MRWAELATVFLATLLAGFLFLTNLGDQCLWQDEAQTACLAKTILTGGIPRGYDGKNFFSQELGVENWGNYVYRWHTWLSFYLVAGSFAILGQTTFAARLPFAVLGLASVPLAYFTARSLWQNRRAAALAAFLLATCVPYLILSRQCRYYSACAFFSLLGLWAYDRLMRRLRGSVLLFVVAAVLLFHCFYVYWGVLVAALLLHAAVFHRDRLTALAIWSTCSFLVVLPWLIWLFWPPVAVYPHEARNVSYAVLALQYFSKLVQHVFSPVLFAALVVAAGVDGVRRRRFPAPDALTTRSAALLLSFVAVCVVTLVIATPNYFFRYLAPIIPPLCMLGGRILDSAMRIHVALGIAALAAMLFFSPLQDYYYELTHHYVGPTEGIVQFLNSHAKPDDVIGITYGDLPVKFYTNLRVVGGLTGEDLTPILKARWIILRNFVVCEKDWAVRNYMAKNLKAADYRRYDVDVPDVPFDNRECPDEHRYKTATGAPKVTILEKMPE